MKDHIENAYRVEEENKGGAMEASKEAREDNME
jgi:hypothetical protein